MFASTLDITNSLLVVGVTSIVEIVDSDFSKYITEPIYITLIIVASNTKTNGGSERVGKARGD